MYFEIRSDEQSCTLVKRGQAAGKQALPNNPPSDCVVDPKGGNQCHGARSVLSGCVVRVNQQCSGVECYCIHFPIEAQIRRVKLYVYTL